MADGSNEDAAARANEAEVSLIFFEYKYLYLYVRASQFTLKEGDREEVSLEHLAASLNIL